MQLIALVEIDVAKIPLKTFSVRLNDPAFILWKAENEGGYGMNKQATYRVHMGDPDQSDLLRIRICRGVFPAWRCIMELSRAV
jgi:hypothetical protein